ncbi:MAG: sensor histidine kinase [Flavobacteriales bacterium]|nr:sensor histidine kinase [Flavobacteriales bacterium]
MDSALLFFIEAHEPYFSHQYESALEKFVASKMLFDRLKQSRSSTFLEAYIGNLVYFKKQVERALDIYYSVLHEDSSSNLLKAKMHHNIGALLMEYQRQDLDSSDQEVRRAAIVGIESHLDTSIVLARRAGDLQSVANTLSVWSGFKTQQGDYAAAIDMIDSSKYFAFLYHDDNRIAFANIKQSVLLDSLRNYEAALDTAMKAVEYFEREHNYDQLIHALGKVARTQVLMQDYPAAYHTLSRCLELYQTYVNDRNLEHVSRFQILYETAEKELALTEQQQELDYRNRVIIYTILASFIVFLLLLVLLQRSRQKSIRKQNEIQIQHKQEQIAAVITAQEEERSRIAKDLHDGIGQQLSSIKMAVRNLITNDSIDGENVLNSIQAVASETRNISHQMMPKSLSAVGLSAAIEGMLRDSLTDNISYVFDSFGTEKNVQIPVKIALYRIAQELIQNIIKHSQAKQVDFQLVFKDQSVILRCEDDGIGFNDQKEKTGIGLINLHSRVESIQGEIDIETKPNSGTCVTIKTPLYD